MRQSDFKGNQCKRAIIRKNQFFMLWKSVMKHWCAVCIETVWGQRLYINIIMIIIEWLSQEVSHTGRDKEKDSRSEPVVTHALAITSREQWLI